MAEELNFRKRPVVIQAVQWTGENLREVICFTDGPPDARSTHASMKWEEYCDLVKSDGLKIYTLEGKMSADVGDWIIKGVKGEHYPCKPDVFELTYEPARAQLPSQGGETSAEGDRPGYDALWLWFSLSRSSYAVLPRVMMHDMPDAWQAAFARLMDEWDETWIKQPNIGARVQITDSDGKLIGTPGWLLNYRHPDRDQLDRMRATYSQQ